MFCVQKRFWAGVVAGVMEARVTTLTNFRHPSVVKTLPAASLVILLASASNAGDLEGPVTEPEVISPSRIGSDVHAFYLGLAGG